MWGRPRPPAAYASLCPELFLTTLLEQRLLLSSLLDLTHQLLHSPLQAGVVEPIHIQTIQEFFSLDLRPLQRPFQPLQLKLSLLLFVSC